VQRVWLHAVSVGEVNVSKPLVAALEEALPGGEVVVSTITETGQEVATRAFGADRVFYCPYDFSWMVRRALDRTRPDMLVLMELEIWPNLIREATRRGIPVIVANGRISDRAFARYRHTKWAFRGSLRRLAAFCAQDETCAARARELGVPAERVHVTGNLKFDSVPAAPSEAKVAALRQQLGIGAEDRVIVGGSTHPTEEAALGRAYDALKKDHAGLRLVVVPRHPERFAAAEADLRALGLAVWRLTRADAGEGPEPDAVVLVDRMGVLGSLYALASVAVVGGSFYRHGGQNPIEPAALGVPPVFGPHMFNFQQVAQLLLDSKACVKLETSSELAGTLHALLQDEQRREALGRRARAAVEGARGATPRTIRLIRRILPPTTPSSARSRRAIE
jgi:3-deoxy-D-manno-octulosonic-acid transferase